MKAGGAVLLHGLGRTAGSMAALARALDEAGYDTLCLDYPSRRLDLSAIATRIAPAVERLAQRHGGTVDIITHSMGGLVARILMRQSLCAGRAGPRFRRVVMLGPPNAGSELADRLQAVALYRRLFGPAGAELVTRRDADLAARLGPGTFADVEIGVVAGTRSLDPVGWLLLPKPNDGKVSVAATRLVGMTDHLVLPVSHTLMLRDARVIAATLAFLRDGRFP